MHPKLGFYAFLLEGTAWSAVALGQSSDKTLVAYLLAHAGAAAVLALFLYPLLPARLKEPRLPILVLFFGMAYAIPLFGFIGLIAAIVILRMSAKQTLADPFEAITLPVIDPHQRASGGFRQAGMGAFIANTKAPVSTRLQALVALQNIPGRVASPLLRNVLSDPSEDIRLLAYGMLDNQEKGLNNLIHAERNRYAEASDPAARIVSAQRLSALYWELVYHDLVQGDLRRHALLQSQQYTMEALGPSRDNAALHLRIARLRQMLGETPAARLSYERALSLGMPRTRIVPYLAELAFDAGDYDSVCMWMSELRDWRSLPRLKPIIEYWNQS